MDMEGTSKPTVNCPETRLSQYLFAGKEYPNYQPGNWFSHNYFFAKNVQSIQELADDTTRQLRPIELIQKAFESNLVPNEETLVFALAVCCRQKESETLRQGAYAALDKICSSPRHFLLFVKFASKLSKQQELDTVVKHGWGHGFRKAVNNWYLSKEPMELAKCVTRYRSRYGWKHKDIIKLSHPTTDQSEKKAVLKYIMCGLEETKKAFADKPEVAKILQYIQNVEEFKHCEDELQAACLLEKYDLTLDHVPGHLLKSGEVWNSLIQSMDVTTLLNNLQRIHNLGLLKRNAPIVAKIVDQITNDENFLNFHKVHPAFVLITLRNYENSGKPLSYEKQQIKHVVGSSLPPRRNSKIIGGLYETLSLSFNNRQSTGLRYLVTIKMSKDMLYSPTWHSGNVNGAEAACMIALSLERCERAVTVATFKNSGIQVINFAHIHTFGKALAKLKRTPAGTVNLSKPITWAMNTKRKIDVFINVVDQISEKYDLTVQALAAYKSKMTCPETKLINCAVCCSSSYDTVNYDKDVLTINGFDATVPKVIEAFAKSLF